MDVLLETFRIAHNTSNGYLLASTLTPSAPPENPAYLYDLRSSSSPNAISADVRYATVYNSSIDFSSKAEANAWMDIYVAFYNSILEIIKAEELENQWKRAKGSRVRETDGARQWGVVYNAWKEVVNATVRGYAGQAGFAAWSVPTLYVVGRHLRAFAIRADDWGRRARDAGQAELDGGGGGFGEDVEEGGENEKLEDAARLINRIFGICISDRAPIELSRKWAIYDVTNQLFKTYFKLNSIPLCKNILRSLQASSSDIPPLSAFPKPHVTTFHYFHGVISFLSEDYGAAEHHLTSALRLCLHPSRLLPNRRSSQTMQRRAVDKAASQNRRLILTYLIPTRMITSRTLPSPELLASNAVLERLFAPLCRCVKRGDLGGFDRALEDGMEQFAEKRIYLTLERARDLCLRNVLRMVVGCEDAVGENGEKMRRTRVRVEEFWVGLRVSLRGGVKRERYGGSADASTGGMNGGDEGSGELDREEAECLVANCIYKGLMKGYISREKSTVVLSKNGAFPGTGV